MEKIKLKGGKLKMKYKIKVWIPIEDDEETIYSSLKEAKDEVKNLELMQPENKYDIEEIKCITK